MGSCVRAAASVVGAGAAQGLGGRRGFEEEEDEEDGAAAPAPGLPETSIPHRHCLIPSSQCSTAQAL